MKIKYSSLLIIWLFLFTACSKKATTKVDPIVQVKETSFVNPVLSSGPDPWIIRKDENYYYLHTLGNRIAIWKTRTVSHLRNAEIKTVWTPPTTGSNSKNIWAPELHYLNSKWYIYYTAGASADFATQRIFVLENSSANPLEGTWTEKGKIGDPDADYFAIDGTVFEHQGKNYLIWSGHISAADNTQRLFIAPMSNPWTLSAKRVQISQPDYEWEKIGTPSVNEGPEILTNTKGNVFLIYSASGCWTDDYSLGLISLKEGGDPLNPADWTKSNQPVFTKNPG
ncbi:MAG: family 43 glycosylhydrolase, partial [Daejeonella sp.]|nr:family 43 glycosylhydrolase [Daejeonella sp.]